MQSPTRSSERRSLPIEARRVAPVARPRMTRTAAWTGHGRVMDVSWTWSATLYEKCGRLVARVAARADEHGKEGDEGRVAVEERLVPAEDDGGGGLEEEQRLPMPRQASEAGSAEAEAGQRLGARCALQGSGAGAHGEERLGTGEGVSERG